MTKKNEGKRAMYRGPSVHNRQISRKDFVQAGVSEDDLPEEFKGLEWSQQPGRRWADLAGLPQSVIDILEEDPSMEVKKGDEIISPAHEEAGEVFPDGSGPGVDGNPVLHDEAGALGFSDADGTATNAV